MNAKRDTIGGDGSVRINVVLPPRLAAMLERRVRAWDDPAVEGSRSNVLRAVLLIGLELLDKRDGGRRAWKRRRGG